MEIFKDLSTAPLPVILTLCGIFLLVVAILPIKLTIIKPLSPQQQKISAITGIIFVVVGVVLYSLQTSFLTIPTMSKISKITIVAPPPDFNIAVQLTTENGGIFEVKGNVSPYKENPDLRIIVLVHSSNPYVSGWWIQSPAIVSEKGDWIADVQIGSNYSHPSVGNELDIIALVVNKEKIGVDPHVDDISNLEPIIQSDVTHLTIIEIY